MNRERIVGLLETFIRWGIESGNELAKDYNQGRLLAFYACADEVEALLEICEACDGSGKSNYGPNVYGDDVIYKCPRCNGTGREAK